MRYPTPKSPQPMSLRKNRLIEPQKKLELTGKHYSNQEIRSSFSDAKKTVKKVDSPIDQIDLVKA